MKWWICLLAFFPIVAKGDLNDELNRFFEKAGANVNVTSGEIYQGQKAGYMTGGGITVRGKIINSKPVSISLPSFDAGCGGIDIFNGGFTFINHQQLVETLKSIGSSAMGYAFLLGLETVSPQVSGVIKNLQNWSNQVNALNINSCEAAKFAVGSAWPKRTAASQEVCRRIAGDDGMFTNYVKARHDCAQKNKYDGMMSADSKKNGFLRDEFNIAWESIQKQPYLSRDKELAEFFMSLIGTVIFHKDSSPERLASKIKDESFLQAMIEGGKTTIYQCKGQNCLQVSEKEMDFSSSNSWLGRVRNQLISMQEKILSDTELSEEEKALLTRSRLPLYKIVNVLTAYMKGACPVNLYQVAEIVAMDLLMQFLGEAIETIREGALQFKTEKMYGGDEITDFLEELKHVEEKVRHYETRSMQLFEREFLLIQKVQLIEDQLRAELSFF
jgi:conjugative transfer pilus assembly protein TraH